MEDLILVLVDGVFIARIEEDNSRGRGVVTKRGEKLVRTLVPIFSRTKRRQVSHVMMMLVLVCKTCS